MEDRKVIESLVLSCIYQDLTLVAETNLKPSDFELDVTCFYFQLAQELVKNIKRVDELSIASWVGANGLKELYDQYGGFKRVKNLLSLGDVNNYNSYVDNLKKYILIDNLKNKRGFDIYKEITYNGKKIIPGDMLPYMTSNEFHDFIQLLFSDIEVELADQDMVFEQLYYTEEELRVMQEGKEENTSHFDITLEWEENGEYRYIQSLKMIDEILGGYERKNGVHIVGATSGSFKTTFCLNVALGLVTTSKEKVVISSNEQVSRYYKDLLMAMVCQHVFKCHSLTRQKISRNKFDEEEMKVVRAANEFIKEKFGDRLRFLSVNSFNSKKMTKLMKRLKLSEGVSYWIFDTFKYAGEEGGNNSQNQNIVQELVQMSRDFDAVGRQYDIGVILPTQLLVTTDKLSYLTTQALANSKQIAEVASSVVLFRRIKPFELDKNDKKYFLKPFVYKWDGIRKTYIKKDIEVIDPFNTDEERKRRFNKEVLCKDNQYLLMFICKNRHGSTDKNPILEVNTISGLITDKCYAGFINTGVLAQ